MERILIIEDDKKLIRGLEDFFQTQGYEVETAGTGKKGMELVRQRAPDLIILDIMLPDISGLDVCRQLKGEIPSLRILVLSAKGEEVDKVIGLEIGADDYLTKPFGVRELLARTRVLLRRNETPGEEISRYTLGEATVDLKSYQVIRGRKKMRLTTLETKILSYLIAHLNKVVTRNQLLNEIWGFSSYPTTRTIDNLVLKLRKKIEPDPGNPKYILTVYGAGYKLVGD